MDDAHGEDVEVDRSFRQLLGHRMRPASAWALKTAASALETDGVAGTLIITIPRQAKQGLEVSFLVGTCEVVQRGFGT